MNRRKGGERLPFSPELSQQPQNKKNTSTGRVRRSLLIAVAALAITATLASSASAFPKYNYSFSFGPHGTGNGQISYVASSLSTDSSGNVYVVDEGNHRIEVFDSSGNYVTQFGQAQLFEPEGIAIDSAGNRWVTDGSYEKVFKYNSKNEYVSSFGEYGIGNGQFQDVASIDVDSKTNIWVLDESNGRLQEFNSAGKYIRQIKSGTYSGHEFSPAGNVAIDSKDNVWVNNGLGSEGVAKFNSEGTFVTEIGGEVSSSASFTTEVDALDRVWVDFTVPIGGLSWNNIFVFDSKGEVLGQFGGSPEFEEPGGVIFQPTDIAFDPSGNPWIFNYSSGNSIQKWLPMADATTKAATEVGLETTLNGGVNPNGISTSYLFEYGTTTAYGTKTPTTFKSIGSGTTEVELSKRTGGFAKETTYHYRVVATSAAGTTYGKDVSFYTGVPAHNTSPPVVTPSTPTKGVPVTTSNGTWTGTPAPTFNYRWKRCTNLACTGAVVITGETNSTYTPVEADVGFPIYSVVTGRNGTGVEIVNSSPTAPVKP
jgi:hypothetical protein